MSVPDRFWKWADAYYGASSVDLVDIEALYDSAITHEENVTLFKQNCPNTGYRAPQESPERRLIQVHAPGIHSRASASTLYTDLLSQPRIIGVIADVNEGKTMLLYNIIEEVKRDHSFNLFYYGLREDVQAGTRVYSVAEIESIRNSVIIIDELSSLFDFDDRKERKKIERSLRLINHNNNVLIVCGTPENYKKFISAKLDAIIYKSTTIADCINGSRVKDKLLAYKGNEMGSEMLDLRINQALVYDGNHYKVIEVNYYEKYDTKRNNESVLKSVHKNVQ